MLFVPCSIADASRRLSAIEGDEVDDFPEKTVKKLFIFFTLFKTV
jgi:hypothetical protein